MHDELENAGAVFNPDYLHLMGLSTIDDCTHDLQSQWSQKVGLA